MKKIILAFSAILLLGAFAVPKNKPEINCLKQSDKFVVDGKANDWHTDSLRFDDKTGFAYAFSNNEKELFIQLKMLNKNVQRKAMITGFTLWIDPAGKAKHVLGIEYPRGRMHEQHTRESGESTPGKYAHHRPASGGHITAEQVAVLNHRFQMEKPVLKGFEKAGMKQASAGTDGIRVLMRMDTLGHIIYEAAIPLKMIFAHPEDYLQKDKSFSVVFETGYLQVDMSRMQGRGGMGGGHGQGMGGGQHPDGSRMAFMESMTEASHLKIKTVHLYQLK